MKLTSAILALLCATIAAHAGEDALPGIAAQPTSYFYTGKPYDSDLDAYAFAFRSYAPSFTRWTTRDPSGFPDGANNAAYISMPNKALDPLGLRVEVYSHNASFGSSGGGGVSGLFQHANLRILPDKPSDFANRPTNSWQTDESGNRYFTLSAGPDSSGNLVSDINRPTDSASVAQAYRGIVQRHNGVSDTAFINCLLDADHGYADNLDYDLFPDLANGYNSNSYVSGLLAATGGRGPKLSGTVFPGWKKPVPASAFAHNDCE